MWFNNLVSIKWWNELWFPDTFSNFLSYLLMETHPDLKHDEIWAEFYEKSCWGINSDLFNSTNPILWHSVKSTNIVDLAF